MTNTALNPFASQSTGGNGGGALARGNEQRAVAEVQAAVLMAKRFPRDQVQAMDRILNAFTRPTLAEVSQYQYSKGGTDVSGPSIRSAEAIAQQWGNIDFGFRELSRGVGQDGVPFSEVEAYAWDMETLTRKPLQFIVRHWRDTKKGGYQIKEEREVYELVANQAQRRVRACLLSIIPGDVTEAAMKQADMTLKTTADTSPEAMSKMVEAFTAFGVTKEQIEARIQRRIDAIQPAQVVSLKKIYVSLRDGMSSAQDWFDVAGQDADVDLHKEKSPPPKPECTPEAFAKNIDKVADALIDGSSAPEYVIEQFEKRYTLSEAQKDAIRDLAKTPAVEDNSVEDNSDFVAAMEGAEQLP